jgi:hypothetical protein
VAGSETTYGLHHRTAMLSDDAQTLLMKWERTDGANREHLDGAPGC